MYRFELGSEEAEGYDFSKERFCHPSVQFDFFSNISMTVASSITKWVVVLAWFEHLGGLLNYRRHLFFPAGLGSGKT